jgi:uncharacterized Zn-finger protein
MAEQSVPYFQNSAGHREIRVGAHEFMCIGAKPPFDHPHVFLDMGSDTEIVCPYCSTLYRFDAALKSGLCLPVDALWSEPEAA